MGLPRRSFADRDQIEACVHALRARVAAQPGGILQLSRMAEIDRRTARCGPCWTAHGFVALCLVAFLLQATDPFVEYAGSFIPALVAQGEWWRVVTANLLHSLGLFPFHLGLNLLLVVAIGRLVERSLGSVRTLVVFGGSALGAMLGCGWARYPEVVGASGVAAGLVGALVCLEFASPHRMPAHWRIPRRVLVIALLAQVVMDALTPSIAAAAHVGGFLAGYGVTRSLEWGASRGRPIGAAVRVSAALCLAALVFGIAAALPLARRGGAALERHALRLAHTPDASIVHDNQVAWLIATETAASDLGLQVAVLLAERAVEGSGRTDPDFLDTLAEVLFAAGDIAGALATIDEAILISAGERYFWEQRRRFTGERAADDRPEPPVLPWVFRGFGDEEELDPDVFDPYAPSATI